MVAELPFQEPEAAMMLHIAGVGIVLIAMMASLVCGMIQMWKQEKNVEVREFFEYLPTVRIATRAGRRCHKPGCGHIRNLTVAGGRVRDFAPCFNCFPERYTIQEVKTRNMRCYGMAAGIVLLVGFALGSLATLCGMSMTPGRYGFEENPWQALGPGRAKDELALGDDRSSKEERRGRKVIAEIDESELMVVWTSIPGKPNTHSQKNYDKYSVNQDFMNAYTIRSIDMYMSEEDESLESGYAPRYLVDEKLVDEKLEEGKFHNIEKIPFKEQFEQLEKKFHDVVHSLVFEGIHLVVFAGTPLGMITWIILSYFSRLFFTAVQKRTKRAKEPKRKSRRRRAEVRRQHKTMFLVVLVNSNLEAAKGMEDALQRLAEINQQTLQGIQTLAEEMRSSAAAGTAREQSITASFSNTLQAIQQQSAEAQHILLQAQETAVTTFEEIGSSLERAVKGRKPGDVELHKLIKPPEIFSPGTWQEEKNGFMEFKQRLRVWLGAMDEDLVETMDLVENDLRKNEVLDMKDMTDEAKTQSRKLYSILASYTKGRPYRVVRHTTEENGMEAYRMLLLEYQPVNRARSLELFHNIMNFRFAKDKGIAENILEYEERIEQYEKSTGEKVQENLKVSTLIQGMKPEVKRHLLLNLDEKTKYPALRQYLVNYESTEKWTNSLTIPRILRSPKEHPIGPLLT